MVDDLLIGSYKLYDQCYLYNNVNYLDQSVNSNPLDKVEILSCPSFRNKEQVLQSITYDSNKNSFSKFKSFNIDIIYNQYNVINQDYYSISNFKQLSIYKGDKLVYSGNLLPEPYHSLENQEYNRINMKWLKTTTSNNIDVQYVLTVSFKNTLFLLFFNHLLNNLLHVHSFKTHYNIKHFKWSPLYNNLLLSTEDNQLHLLSFNSFIYLDKDYKIPKYNESIYKKDDNNNNNNDDGDEQQEYHLIEWIDNEHFIILCQHIIRSNEKVDIQLKEKKDLFSLSTQVMPKISFLNSQQQESEIIQINSGNSNSNSSLISSLFMIDKSDNNDTLFNISNIKENQHQHQHQQQQRNNFTIYQFKISKQQIQQFNIFKSKDIQLQNPNLSLYSSDNRNLIISSTLSHFIYFLTIDSTSNIIQYQYKLDISSGSGSSTLDSNNGNNQIYCKGISLIQNQKHFKLLVMQGEKCSSITSTLLPKPYSLFTVHLNVYNLINNNNNKNNNNDNNDNQPNLSIFFKEFQLFQNILLDKIGSIERVLDTHTKKLDDLDNAIKNLSNNNKN
ncbi:hypothetical protein CYY_006990 [Polysphondylium violaceum]|uniref:Uncharacterized protein n=1 Tax=Polysphondylium violaceum TaxID=133409 RepID=A0A8J4PRK5_9MYCE|nr:hypothetical protein CYY_006990 [Polysphondylium violaceum]